MNDMKIYFAVNDQKESKTKEVASLIINFLKKSGVIVMSNVSDEKVSDFSTQDLEKISQTGEVLLEKMDGVIIEGTNPLFEAGYLIALALAHKKPILYLCQKNKNIDKNFFRLSQDQATAQYFFPVYYSLPELEKVLGEFLQKIEKGDGRELPVIKFTLRLTPRIDRYLSWKVNNTELTKADFLRDEIEKMIKGDKDYLKFEK